MAYKSIIKKRQYLNDWYKKVYQKRKAKKICTKCGKRKPIKGLICLKCYKIKRKCLQALYKRDPLYTRNARRRWVAHNKRKVKAYQIKYRPRNNLLVARLHLKRKRQGLCPRCGKIVTANFILCALCRSKRNAYKKKYRAGIKEKKKVFMQQIDKKIAIGLAKFTKNLNVNP